MIPINWHAKTISETLDAIHSTQYGLSEEEAERRLGIYGKNQLETYKTPSVLMRFLYQFHNIFIYVLLVSGVITVFLNHFVDASVIFGVVILNAIFGFIQEGKAEKAILVIRNMLSPTANVIRNGTSYNILAELLVPGDIVKIKSGDKAPADLRLLQVKNLQIQESILTGESNAIEKSIDAVSEDADLVERSSMVYGGTAVTYGKATGVVIATSVNTEIGKIGTLLKKIQPLTTPLLRQINSFARWITLAIIVLSLLTFLVGVFLWGEPIEQVFMSVVGLAVAAIPEGLPPILTIILAIGVTRMAKLNAIIRHLPAVETMGAITTICTDKTGTLTRNEQNIKNIITAKNYYDVKESDSVIFDINNEVVSLDSHHDLLRAIHAAILCNDAEFSKVSDKVINVLGNPVDKALLELGLKAKVDLHFLQNSYPRKDLIPYESEHKFMATLHHSHTGKGFIYVKGAPEHILEMCSWQQSNGTLEALDIDCWTKNIDSLANLGYRIIALAYKDASLEKDDLLFQDVKENLVLVAVFGLIDSPRIEAIHAVEECHNAGIKVKMITGDHATTAATIASEVGIDIKYGVLTGKDIDRMDDIELADKVKQVNVYARTTPQHKLRLVEALQVGGELVAMTGDGVNDAPALRKADIGVSMGQKGAEIAKEASAMILADDNFATIVNAIKEGRTVYDNIKKVILFALPTNMAEGFVIILAIIFGFLLPITPVQILWVNMITSVGLSVALGFEPAENNIMHRIPRKPKTPILSGFLIWRLAFVTILLVACVFGLFVWQRFAGVDINTARTIAVNMLVCGETIYLINCRRIHGSSWNLKTIFGSKPILISIFATIAFQLMFTYLPIMQHFFGTTKINLIQWLYIILLSIGVFILVELEKLIVRYFGKHFQNA